MDPNAGFTFLWLNIRRFIVDLHGSVLVYDGLGCCSGWISRFYADGGVILCVLLLFIVVVLSLIYVIICRCQAEERILSCHQSTIDVDSLPYRTFPKRFIKSVITLKIIASTPVFWDLLGAGVTGILLAAIFENDNGRLVRLVVRIVIFLGAIESEILRCLTRRPRVFDDIGLLVISFLIFVLLV